MFMVPFFPTMFTANLSTSIENGYGSSVMGSRNIHLAQPHQGNPSGNGISYARRFQPNSSL